MEVFEDDADADDDDDEDGKEGHVFNRDLVYNRAVERGISDELLIGSLDDVDGLGTEAILACTGLSTVLG